MEKREKYTKVLTDIENLLEGEEDNISIMATISCELKQAFETFSWVGFYRVIKPDILKIGPYQGFHGCIEISFAKGVCGKCASEKKPQIVGDVSKTPYYISCSSETKSEIVIPVLDMRGELIAVLDIDSDHYNNFDDVDQSYLESLCSLFKRI